MKYLHFLNGLAYDSMPPAPCQEKIYDLRKRAGGGAQGGFGRGPRRAGRGTAGGFPRGSAARTGRGRHAAGGRPSAVRESFRPI